MLTLTEIKSADFSVYCVCHMDVTLVYLVFSRSSRLMSSILSLSSGFSSKLSHRRPETFIRIQSRQQTFSQCQTSDNLRKAPLVVTKHVNDYTTHCLPRARLSSGSAVLGRLVTIETGDSLWRSLATLAANELSLQLSLKLPTSAETWDELFSEEPIPASSVLSWFCWRFPGIEGTFICMTDVAVGGFALSGSAELQPSGSARLGVTQRSRDFKLSSLLKERAAGSIVVWSVCCGPWEDDKLPFKAESDEDRVSNRERFPPADRDVSSW